MFSLKAKPISPKYASLALHEHDDDEVATPEKRSSSEENEQSSPLLNLPEDPLASSSSQTSQLSKLLLWLSLALALLSTTNIALLPSTLKKYQAYPYSDLDLAALPFGDARLGIDRAAAQVKSLHPEYNRAWPDKIARVSRKLKDAVWGQGSQVYITVEDSTIMRFPVPSTGIDRCALSWREIPGRAKGVTTKGDITEVEVWQLIAPSIKSGAASSSIAKLDYDTLSYSTLPIRGELLGVLDLTAKPNSTTAEFSCPVEDGSLTVELRCQRVACHLSFMQIDVAPRFGFELVRKRA